MLKDLYSDDMDKNQSYEKNLGQTLTPPEIVDYMVKESITACLENQKNGERLNILDPASGTGRFMLGVADYCWKNNIDFIMWNIDIDPKMFGACKQHALHYKIPAIVILGDALLNDFKEAVACQNGVETALDVQEIIQIFQKITSKSNPQKQAELF